MSKMTKSEFYNLIDEWISQPKERWNHVTLVAYFYHKYKQRNGVNFTPNRWSGNPASSKECRDIARIFKLFAIDNYSELNSENKKLERIKTNQKIYNYINWIFDFKYRYGDNGVAVTTQFLFAPYNLNEFQIMYSKALKKNDSASKIDKLLNWCKKEMPEILDSHEIQNIKDIELIKKYAEMYNLEDNSNEIILIKKSIKMGLINE